MLWTASSRIRGAAIVQKAVEHLRASAPRIANALLLAILVLMVLHNWRMFRFSPKVVESQYFPPLPSQPSLDMNHMVNAHLFGSVSVVLMGGEAPLSSLGLKLDGIVVSNNPKDSLALIAASGDDKVYALGAQVVPGVVIRSIESDRVLLEHNGVLESLKLPHSDEGIGVRLSGVPGYGSDGSGVAGGGISGAGDVASSSSLGQIRDTVVANPKGFLEMVHVMPAMNDGKQVGYRVFPGQDSKVLGALGLRAGDVVTTVNGVSLTDSGAAAGIVPKLKSAEHLTIAYVREGEARTEDVSLKSEN